MTLIHGGGYSKDQKEAFKEIIFSNVVQSMRVVLEAMEKLKIPLDDSENKPYQTLISESAAQIEDRDLPEKITKAIKNLYNDKGVQECIRRYQILTQIARISIK
jgi:guanine nucleotide-binding protein G(i) subunit alpha